MSDSLWPCGPYPPGSSVHGISQTRIWEWVAISSSTGSSWPRDWTHVSCVSCTGRWALCPWCPWEAPYCRGWPRLYLPVLSPLRDGIGLRSTWRPALVQLRSAGCWPWPWGPNHSLISNTCWRPCGCPSPTLPGRAQSCSSSWFSASANDLSLLPATSGRNKVLWQPVFLCPTAIQVLRVKPQLVSLPAP